MKKKIYISGPITGNMENYRSEFAMAAQMVADNGDIPLNPAVLPQGMSQRDYMTICFAMLETADLVVMLPGWGSSEGACVERLYAAKIGTPVMTLEAFEEAMALLK